MRNSDLLIKIINALILTSSRKTSKIYAVSVINTIIETLAQKFEFYRYIKIVPDIEKNKDFVEIAYDIDGIEPQEIAKAIEVLVRVIYMDLRSKCGLNFLDEIKKIIGTQVIWRLRELGIDLDLLQTEQHYIYRKYTRGKMSNKIDNKTISSYSWRDVKNWKIDDKTKSCTIYDGEGKILDEINLEMIMKDYIETLDEDDIDEIQTYERIGVNIDLKEKEFLKLLKDRDIDLETAMYILRISKQELHNIISKLLKLEMLHYVSDKEIIITEVGLDWLKSKENEDANIIRI